MLTVAADRVPVNVPVFPERETIEVMLLAVRLLIVAFVVTTRLQAVAT